MTSLLNRLFGREPKSAQLAKERLKTVLVYDRTNLTHGTLDTLKDELIQVVSRHAEVDRDDVRLEMTQDGRHQRLIANIPLRSGRKRGQAG
jgi:cell division topological specificity factor